MTNLGKQTCPGWDSPYPVVVGDSPTLWQWGTVLPCGSGGQSYPVVVCEGLQQRAEPAEVGCLQLVPQPMDRPAARVPGPVPLSRLGVTCAGHGQSWVKTKHVAVHVHSGCERTHFRLEALQRDVHTGAPLEKRLFSCRTGRMRERRTGTNSLSCRSSPVGVLHSQLLGQTLSAPGSAPSRTRPGKPSKGRK